MAKKNGLLIAAGLGVLALGAVALKGRPGDVVTGKSGKSWRVVMLGNASGVKTYEVFAPASSFGPHGELSVLRYTQTGSEVASRKIVGVGTGVPVSIVQTAASDFSLPFDPSKMPA